MKKKNRKKYLKYKAKLKSLNRYGVYFASKCETCGTERFFYERYDAICCITCDEWVDERCGDPNCPYCSVRPSTPSEALWLETTRNDWGKDWRRSNYQHKNDGRIRHEIKRKRYSEIKNKKE